MRKPLPYITLEKRKGVEKLLEWAVEGYKKSTSVNGKRMWKQRIDFLAKLQKQQTYTEEDKVMFNGMRKEYMTEKHLDKIADLSKGTL